MKNVLIDDNALLAATETSLSWNYGENDVSNLEFAIAFTETKDIIESYFRACNLRVVGTK